MTEVKIDPKVNAHVETALAPHADDLLAAPLGTRYVAICEFSVVEHAEKSTGELDDDGNPVAAHVVRIRPVLLEVATGDDEDHVRRAHRALWTKRTSDGTLTASADRDRADTDLRLAAGLITGE